MSGRWAQKPHTHLFSTAALVAMLCCAVLVMWGDALSDDVLKSHQKISNSEGGFMGTLDYHDWFGCSIVSLGDLDGDAVADIAVGAKGDDQGGIGRGALWVLFLNSDGTVKTHQKISGSEGGFTGMLDNGDHFGCSVAALGDLDNDAVGDLAVGALEEDDGGDDRGAVWILFLNSDGTVKANQKISSREGGFTGIIDNEDRFGCSVASLGDLDGDAVADMAVGATEDDDGGYDSGAVWMLFLNSDGTVKAHQKISNSEGGFTGMLDSGDHFGCSVASLGDLNDDTVGDLAVGATEDDDGGYNRGAVWILFLNSDGTVKTHQKISNSEGGFTGMLDDGDRFGCSVASLGDLDGDAVADMAVGAAEDDDGGAGCGAVWMLFLNSDGTVKAHQKISSSEGDFTGILDNGDHFSCSVASLGDLDGDDVADMAVGATEDDDGAYDCGALWLLFLEIPVCSVYPSSIGFFDPVPLGDPRDTSFAIHNMGAGTLTGSIGEACDHFSIVSGGGAFSLGADESRAVTVRFEPAQPGTHECWIETGESICLDVNCRGVCDPLARVETEQRLTFGLYENLPDPFNQLTRIRFSLDREDAVTLAIFDVAGRYVYTLINRRMAPGEYSEEWDCRNGSRQKVPSGIYFCRLEAGDDALMMKMVVVK